MLDDETLRDGLQSPSVRCPSIDEKIRILHLIDRLGIDTANIGLPGAGAQVAADVERLAREIADQRLAVQANCAARTVIADIRPIAEISQRAGIPIECCTFIGSSPLRRYAEGWSLDELLRLTEEAITFAVREGLPVMYVTEDTTRADPDSLRQLYSTAVRAGAKRVCVADTVGHATPAGAAAVVRFIGTVLDECGGGVGIDWHGHRDRDFAIANSMAALEAGATRLHGAAIGIGERVGNTPMDTLLVNLVLAGYLDRDLTALVEYLRDRVGGDRRGDPAQLSRGRPRRVQDGDRRPRRRGDQGLPQGRSRSGRCGVFGGARGDGRAQPGDRDRADVGEIERRLLAGEARPGSRTGGRGSHLRPCQGVGVRADRTGNPEAYRAWLLTRFSMAGSAARSTSPTDWKLFALSLSMVSCGVCHGW